MAKSINRHFHFLGSSKRAKPSGPLWLPAADVYQTTDGWLVKVELAGVSAEDIEIDIQGNTLYIAGSRKDKSCGGGMSYHQMEITYSTFEKTLNFLLRSMVQRLSTILITGCLLSGSEKRKTNSAIIQKGSK